MAAMAACRAAASSCILSPPRGVPTGWVFGIPAPFVPRNTPSRLIDIDTAQTRPVFK